MPSAKLLQVALRFFFVLNFLIVTPASSSPVKKIERVFHGLASFYADKFHGRKTASGAVYRNDRMTCAHRSLAFGTKLLVKNPDTGSSCIVVVNDRGPFRSDRVVDLSKAAARKLGITGVGKVVCYAGRHLKNLLDDHDDGNGVSTPKVAVRSAKVKRAVATLEQPKDRLLAEED